MLHKINSWLERAFGYRFVRVFKAIEIEKIKTHVGKNNHFIVEFVGTPGVGKTTLRNYYLNNHKLKFNKQILVEKDIRQYATNTRINANLLHETYKVLINARVKTLNESHMSAGKKLYEMEKFQRYLKWDYIVTVGLNNKIVFFDEHLFHHFRKYPHFLPKDKNTIDFLKNRLYIICWASSDQIIKNIKKRARFGKLNTHHRGKTDDELHAHIKNSIENTNKYSEELIRKGGNVLLINTEKSLEENALKIDQIINKLLNIE